MERAQGGRAVTATTWLQAACLSAFCALMLVRAARARLRQVHCGRCGGGVDTTEGSCPACTVDLGVVRARSDLAERGWLLAFTAILLMFVVIACGASGVWRFVHVDVAAREQGETLSYRVRIRRDRSYAGESTAFYITRDAGLRHGPARRMTHRGVVDLRLGDAHDTLLRLIDRDRAHRRPPDILVEPAEIRIVDDLGQEVASEVEVSCRDSVPSDERQMIEQRTRRLIANAALNPEPYVGLRVWAGHGSSTEALLWCEGESRVHGRAERAQWVEPIGTWAVLASLLVMMVVLPATLAYASQREERRRTQRRSCEEGSTGGGGADA